ncbi:hypothetical protein [Photorhabdus antumapuensis]
MTGVSESSQQSSNLKDEGYSELSTVGPPTLDRLKMIVHQFA